MTRVAIVTGGQRGIGFGIAQALIGSGWTTAITSPEEPTAHTVVAAMRELGPNCGYFQHDLRDTDGFNSVVADIEAQLGPIDALVGNAGVPTQSRGDLLELETESFDTVMSINTRGTFFFAQAVARSMVATNATGFRSIVFITSVSADVVSIDRGDYCMSKAASAMAARLFAARLANHDISVFDVRPGIISSPMTDPVFDKYDDRIAEGLVPARRWGTPQDVGSTIAALVAGSLPFSTGAVIPVDGGLGLHRL